MSEILIGQSYYLRFDSKLWEAMQPYPPLGSLYAASYIRSHGYEVAFFDAMLASSEDEWAQALDLHQPRIAVLYEDNFNYLSKMCLLRMREAAHIMIEMARLHGCTVIAGGADASDHAGLYLDAGADYVLVGEGELTLGELIDQLSGRSKLPISSIQGLVFKNAADSQPRFTGRRPDIRDLDAMPFPAWDLVDVPRYRDIWRERHGFYSINMVSTRGCPYHCNWCAKPIWGQRYNVRSPENVAAELRWLSSTIQPDHIWFVDDIFGLKPGWLPRFADLIESDDTRLPFKCLSRVDLLLREGEIEALRRAGCQIVWVGAESGSQKILDAMEKGTQVEQIYAATQRLHSAGIKAGFFLQFGYPGETRSDIERTLQMVRDCRPDDIGMSVSYPLPGTRFYSAVQEQLGARQNWIDSSDLAMLYQGPFTTKFYRQLHIVLHREFRLRKAWHVLTGSASNQGSGIKKGLRRNKALVALIKNASLLPFERMKLSRLERPSDLAIQPSSQILSPASAAQPSIQSNWKEK